jgi:hypothetical protein
MKMAREFGVEGYRSGLPEEPYSRQRPAAPRRVRTARVAAAAGIAGSAVVAAWKAGRR